MSVWLMLIRLMMISTVKVAGKATVGTAAVVACVTSGGGGGRGWGSGRHVVLDLNRLTVLLGNPLFDHLAVDSLLGVAVGDGHLFALLLRGVDTNLLGHFPTVLLDGHSCLGTGGFAHNLFGGGNSWGGSSWGSWGGCVSSVASKVTETVAVTETAVSEDTGPLCLGIPLTEDALWGASI